MDEQMTTAELEKIHAEIGKLMAETVKINKEATWYPFVVVGGIVATLLALIKLFH